MFGAEFSLPFDQETKDRETVGRAHLKRISVVVKSVLLSTWA